VKARDLKRLSLVRLDGMEVEVLAVDPIQETDSVRVTYRHGPAHSLYPLEFARDVPGDTELSEVSYKFPER